MHTHWIKNGHSTLLLFFTGWAMDERPTLPLDPGKMDICICYDYRSLRCPAALLREWHKYPQIIVIGWSMGVWAAGMIFGKATFSERVIRCIAMNGTLTPIHDLTGIPEAIFGGTLEQLNETSLQKFFRRMAGTATEFTFFQQHFPQRLFSEQKEELSAIFREVQAKIREPQSLPWDTALLSTRDNIFPPTNLHRAWEGKARIVSINQPHYPFGAFHSWQQILDL